MWHSLASWTEFLAFLLLGLAFARKYRESQDPGFVWLALAYVIPAVLVTALHAIYSIDLQPRYHQLPQLYSFFDRLKDTLQAAAIALSLYTLRGRPANENLFQWLFNDAPRPAEPLTPRP